MKKATRTGGPRVVFDLGHRPLPEIPLPNDIATRYDETSATGLRVNASMVAETMFESGIRKLIDQIDGWGTFQPVVIPFTGPLDVQPVLQGHRDKDYDLRNDVLYLINIDRRSPRFGQLQRLDLGNGNYPVVLELNDRYWKNDPRSTTLNLLFEEVDEDVNRNGKLDPTPWFTLYPSVNLYNSATNKSEDADYMAAQLILGFKLTDSMVFEGGDDLAERRSKGCGFNYRWPKMVTGHLELLHRLRMEPGKERVHRS